MAKLVACFSRVPEPHSPRLQASRVGQLVAALWPERLPSPSQTWAEERIAISILNPSPSCVLEPGLARIGAPTLNPSSNWKYTGNPIPDENGILLRYDAAMVELCADATASYPMWVYHDANWFIAATMQRLAVMLLGSYHRNPEATAWLLSSGVLGPEQSWDARLRLLKPGEIVRLDRSTWQLTSTVPEVVFAPRERPQHVLEGELRELLAESVSSITPENGPWVLPLSGGVDSRALMMLVKDRAPISTLTFGLQGNRDKPRGNLAIAREVAALSGVKHTELYFPDWFEHSCSALAQDYLLYNDCRDLRAFDIPDLAQLSNRIADEGFTGWIRGDELFGWVHVADDYEVRRNIGLLRLTDFDNLSQSLVSQLPPQQLPESYVRRTDETLEMCRDRLYFNYRLSHHLGFFADVLSTNFELTNPFLSPGIVQFMRTVPDHLRTGKKLFRSVAKGLGPTYRYNRFDDELNLHSLVQFAPLRQLLEPALARGADAGYFPATWLDYVRQALPQPVTYELSYESTSGSVQDLKEWIRRNLPRQLVSLAVQTVTKPKANAERFAFRMFMMTLANEVFEKDAQVLIEN